LREVGSGYMQFIPVVERLPDAEARSPGLGLAAPPPLEEVSPNKKPVTDWTVDARDYGEFLCAIFDEWVARDVGRVFVQLFDVTLGKWMGVGPGLCLFSETCGNALAMEHNGDVFSCDHFVYPRFKLGNILNQSLGDMVNSDFQRQFGAAKKMLCRNTANSVK
jgi:uncharacterized protein